MQAISIYLQQMDPHVWIICCEILNNGIHFKLVKTNYFDVLMQLITDLTEYQLVCGMFTLVFF